MSSYYYNPYQYQRKKFGDEVKSFFRSGSVLSWLLLINVGIWLCICVASLAAWLYKIPADYIEFWVSDYFAVPAYLPKLLARFWTPFSYMFLHFDFWHIFVNMLWLYWFGRIFLEFLGSGKLLTVYLWGGLFGALFFVLSYNIFPVFEAVCFEAYALGASASVMAVVMAVSFYVPRYTLNLLIFGRIRLIWIALIFLVIDVLLIPRGNAGGHIAHLGGALFGFLYAISLKKNFFKLRPFKHLFRPNPFKQKAKKKTTYNYTNDERYNIQKKQEQEEIDRILDKISKQGYDVLSKKEKETLFKKSH
jgi:membrane associated rhomboid family serine protease